VSVDREIVYIDLTLNDSQLWEKSFTHACRKNIKRSRNENIRTVEAVNVGDIKEFHRVYTQTMDRNLASDKYYYPLEYFVAFFEQMPNNARFVLAIKQDQVIAGTLYLHDDTDVYSYLGGADQLFQQARPTNAVVYDTIAWARQSGKKRIILGGGYKPDDGIFRFKASFSPLRAQFRIYKRIHLSQTYDNLCKTWVEYYNLPIEGTYFPAYRALPATITGVANSADHVSVEEDAWKR
jgi:lipid II:glycine glycyltransferase (peptidoglycan interpeptide bridge formation enzyme)